MHFRSKLNYPSPHFPALPASASAERSPRLRSRRRSLRSQRPARPPGASRAPWWQVARWSFWSWFHFRLVVSKGSQNTFRGYLKTKHTQWAQQMGKVWFPCGSKKNSGCQEKKGVTAMIVGPCMQFMKPYMAFAAAAIISSVLVATLAAGSWAERRARMLKRGKEPHVPASMSTS